MNKQEQFFVNGVKRFVKEMNKRGFRVLNKYTDGRAGIEPVTPEAKKLMKKMINANKKH